MEQVVKIGVMSAKEFRDRTLAIARGLYKPRRDEPTIWFSSYRSLAEALSEKNLALLRLVAEREPQSISELAKLSKRTPGNLHRTLKMLENAGLVSLERGIGKTVRPVASYAQVKIEAETTIIPFPRPSVVLKKGHIRASGG